MTDEHDDQEPTREDCGPQEALTMQLAMAFVQERLLAGLEQALLPDWEKEQRKAARSPKRQEEAGDLAMVVKAAQAQVAILRASIAALKRPRSLIQLVDPPPGMPPIAVPGTKLPGKSG